ncbi:ComF family protein [Streptomyces sp. ODS05-4]|uniref:ComF family protein n=1 Tax=Streptomyces sp. ODS05-4 TaxID=2944939 RepID=UPI002109F5C4|nr:ComF family protein [Streptomyces sp. ODS05-4]
MSEWWSEIGGLVLPVSCAGCGRPGPRGRTRVGRTQVCEGCTRRLYGEGARRVWPAPEPAGLPPVFASAPYADSCRALLLAHKERGALPLARPLGAALAAAVRAAVRCGRVREGPVLLVPVPSARRAVRARGHDPARRIAAAAAAELRAAGRPARVLPVLRQRRPVADQAGLTAGERLANMGGALEAAVGAGRLLARGRPVLVDDLMTTGATLAEAARAVRAAPADDARGVQQRSGQGTGAGRRGAHRSAARRREAAPGAERASHDGDRGLTAAVVCAPPISFELNRK